jgi:hypothetical protein
VHLPSLPCLISPALSLSCAQPPPPELAGDPRPLCRPPGAPNAAPSLPEHRPEVSNHPRTFLAAVLFPLQQISARQSRCALVRRIRSAFDRFSPAPCLYFGPRRPTTLTGARAGLGAPDHPSPHSGLLVGVQLTCPKCPLHRSPASSPALTATTPPSSSSGPPRRSWPAPATSAPGARACLASSDFTAVDGSSASHRVVNPPVLLISTAPP